MKSTIGRSSEKLENLVNVSYLGLVRNVIGCREEEIEVMPGITVGELLAALVERHGDPFRLSVLREAENCARQSLCV